ncbi:hypothetical protein ACFOEK_16250 [Litoribrevibacter euphylliae]|uniref:DUF4124 domain-containing protein n=1 Tax=Litoribrevibacter euphylliae TaxID=1834034 RepID=A0ABV7HIP4_9GAMM
MSTSLKAEEYYRYKDKNGVQVINTYIPPEFVKYGYDVITPRGQIIKTVPPAPTEEELAARDEAKRLAAEERKREVVQQQVDERLKKLYSHPDDAKRAMERKLAEIDYQISRKRGQLVTYKSKKARLEEIAAERERSGRSVSEQTIQEIERFNRQIEEANRYIATIEASKDTVRAQFQKDIDRMIEIFNEEHQKRLQRRLSEVE